MPKTAAKAAHKTVHSNVIGINAGQLLKGFPPTFKGKSITSIQYCMKNPPTPPTIPPRSTINGKLVRVKPIASASSSIGNGEYPFTRR